MRAVSGTVLGNRYELTDPIAAGGMGEVWKAHDELLGRTVAVKVLREELVSEPGFLARFRTEARNTARLAHANIATTYDYGESDGSAWLVMELVPGEPLSDLLAREGALEPRRAMRLLAKAAAGLAAAHAAGIVHRDVKPGNLLVTPDGGVKVTDFGIARAAAEAPLTATGQVMGTAAYLAPEQATGRRDLTPAVDVYALGVVAHEMLAGERPFTGESQVAIALAQVNDPPPPLPRWVPGAARELVALCLAKDPLDRPAQAGVVAEVSGRIAEGDDNGAMTVLEKAHGGYRHDPTGRGAGVGGLDPTVVALPPTNVMPPGAAATGSTAGGAMPWEEPSREAPTERGRLAGAGFAGAGLPGNGQQYTGPPQGSPYTGQNSPYQQADPYSNQYANHGPGGPHTGQGPAPAPSEPRRRRMTAPLLGLVAVLLVVLAVLLYHQFGGSAPAGTGTTPSPTTPAPATSSTSPPAPTSASPTSASPSTTATTDTPSATPSTPSASTPSASPTTTSPPSVTTSTPSATTPSTPATTSAAPTATATS